MNDASIPDPRLLDRLAKLLRLAGSSNSYEAEGARIRAQVLLEKHSLSDALHRESVDPVFDDREHPLDISRRLRRWKVALACSLASAHRCIAYVIPGTRKSGGDQLILVGRRSDAEQVRYWYKELVPRIDWLTLEYGAGADRIWAEGFRFGVVDSLAERNFKLGEMDLVQEGLILMQTMEVKAVEQFVTSELKLKPGRSIRVVLDAYHKGKEAGYKMKTP